MQARIYALVSPTDHQVHYVGGWRHHSTVKEGELIEHEYPADVAAWISSLLPLDPITVHLESYRFDDERSFEENERGAAALEQKWIGWFSEEGCSPLLGCNPPAKIRAGFYGWVGGDLANEDGSRRAAHVLHAADETLIVALAGVSKSHVDIPAGSFTPDPEALYWEGHVPSPEEHEAELAKLRLLMAA